ncbi:glycosyltransferase family 4 protein [Collinsella ihumii]|uniref:Glycosyltransferase family 4 protein n=1 Tax=Collinsella ihumii TaxID=1720204 RepID=A0AAW7JP48_9ACTN|nr:glycosyltransferase family 4 protein [Collinsella ihumii]MDN0068604.1 glycosyltransferase family 4 protein [Collinsella ihumii]
MSTLLFNPIDRLRPVGGPCGYLYNLQSGLESLGASDRVDFLPPCHTGAFGFIRSKLWDKAPLSLRERYRRLKQKSDYETLLSAQSSNASLIFNYAQVHFHSPVSLYQCREELSKYEGTVILTSHSPCACHIELFDSISTEYGERFASECGDLSVIDEYAFNRADILVFPTEYSVEPYLNSWPRFAEIIKNKRLMYLLTGIKEPSPKVERSSVRELYNIPESAFVVCYTGRHNEIKGYDLLKEAAEPLLESHPNIVFLVAGKQAPLRGIDHSRWIEAGWTDDPHSLMRASDLFVLPNRETYFDLVLLEALAVGIPVLATRTGGNKWFSQQDGIILVDPNPSSLKRGICQLVSKDKEALQKMGLSNRALYEREFTNEVFACRYLKLLEEIDSRNA